LHLLDLFRVLRTILPLLLLDMRMLVSPKMRSRLMLSASTRNGVPLTPATSSTGATRKCFATHFALTLETVAETTTLYHLPASKPFAAEQVIERTEDHLAADYLPAFDLSGLSVREPNARREVRIWAKALRQGVEISTSAEAVLADCLLTNSAGLENKTFHLLSSHLERAWCVSNQTILQLIKRQLVTGVRAGRNWKVNRASAAHFLLTRGI
jgi:hypothetical protein